MDTSTFEGATWRKSSYSTENGTCIEVAWRKSSYSANYGTCVEVAVADQTVGVRDSKNTALGHLALASAEWHAFVNAVKNDSL